MSTIGTTSATDEAYAELEKLLAARVRAHEGPLFSTSAEPGPLWGHYVMSLPEERRQHYNCHACRRFVQTYGGLAKIDEKSGVHVPLLWSPDGVPEFFRSAVWSLFQLVSQSRITGVFYSPDATWGTPSTRDKKRGEPWTHLHGRSRAVFSDKLKTAGQVMAEKLEEHGMLARALRDYPKPVAAEALRVLEADVLHRSEKAVGLARWFVERHDDSPGQLWRSVALAPPGYCHVRSTVISTLLDDVAAGLSFEKIAARWAEKTHPLQYQRPQAAPKAGAIDAAEKIFEKLGAARSLARRYARLSDVVARLWTPPVVEPERAEGVFGHLKAKRKDSEVKRVELPPTRTTWEKFARDVLPKASKVEASLHARKREPFYGLTTAVHADAPNLLQWENPVAWYFHHGGSLASEWNLSTGWAPVTAVFLAPHQWGAEPSRFSHQPRIAFFALAGAREKAGSTVGLALFPEFLRAEFREVRSVIEAHSASGRLEGIEDGDANGIAFQGLGVTGGALTVRVDESASYVLDRWD